MITAKMVVVVTALIMILTAWGVFEARRYGALVADPIFEGYVVDEAGGHPIEVMLQLTPMPVDSILTASRMVRIGPAYIGQYMIEDSVRIYDGSTPNHERVWPLDRKWVVIVTFDLNGDGSVDISDLVLLIDFMFIDGQ